MLGTQPVLGGRLGKQWAATHAASTSRIFLQKVAHSDGVRFSSWRNIRVCSELLFSNCYELNSLALLCHGFHRNRVGIYLYDTIGGIERVNVFERDASASDINEIAYMFSSPMK